MELILLIALVFAAFAIRRQNTRLKTLEDDFASLRTRLSGDAAVVTQQPEMEVVPAPVEEVAEASEAGPWGMVTPRIVEDDEEPLPETAVAATPPAPTPKRDLETALGARWAVWVGGLALALGGVFLVRYSIEAGIFGPRVRLAGAALFGLLLAAAGELARRRGFRAPAAGIAGAHVPAILTAAATFILFSTIYAAHGIYGFIGPATAFGLLAAIALATLAASLLHGQALAGLGLLGSYVTPVLVASEAPAIWTLFSYLAIVLAAAVAVASLRRWRFLSGAAFMGAGLWSLAYLGISFGRGAAPVAMLTAIGLAVLTGLWLAGAQEDEGRPDPASLIAAFFLAIVTIFLARGAGGAPVGAAYWPAGLLVVALAAAIWRERATPLLHAAGLSLLFIAGFAFFGGRVDIDVLYGDFFFDGVWRQPGDDSFLPWSAALGGLFLIAGAAMARVTVKAEPVRAAVWAFWAALVPLWVVVTAWLSQGDLNIDWRFAGPSLAIAAILVVAAELVSRTESPAETGGRAVACLVLGAAAALCHALLAGFGPVLTTVLTGLAIALPALATRLRNWPVLGWASAGFATVVLIRIGSDPTIAGRDFLGTTPLFNALTPGYFVPAAAAAFAAWQLARTTGGRPRLVLEAFAALFSLVGAAMLVRHAMNGGMIGAGEPSLAEQSIYSLIMIGGGVILLALDRRAPSPVLRNGSMVLGVLSLIAIATAHFFELNPLFTNEATGRFPFFNLLLLAYLLPAVALAAFAWRARGIRPDWYVAALASGAAILAFAWVSLSIRRLFHGEFIGAWKGMDALETYAYSAAWLALGVAILVAGLRLRSRNLRLGSAALVVLAVAKVFVYDMRELEGVLRALSFMGLGAVLIGIGMFYQRMLSGGTVESKTREA